MKKYQNKIDSKQVLVTLLLSIICIIAYAQETIIVDGITFSANKKTLIKYPKDKTDEEYVVPEGTGIINDGAFKYNWHSQIITLPGSLKKLGNGAFYKSDLTTVVWNTYPAVVGNDIWEDSGNSRLSSFLTTENSDNCISINNVLFSKDKKKLLGFPPAKIENRFEGRYEVPEGTGYERNLLMERKHLW